MIAGRTATGLKLAALAAAALAWAGVAWAQPPSLRDQLFREPSDERAFSAPLVARFHTDSGDPFVLDRTPGREVFVRFEASPEIWALTPTAAPGGDVIYKDDMGEPVLRASRLGGLTLFTSERPGGVAAAFAGPAALLRPQPVFNPNALLQSFLQASERAGRAAGRAVNFQFQAEQVAVAVLPLVADAALVTAEAFTEVSNQGDKGRKALARFAHVRIDVGRPPGAQVAGDTVKIKVDPDRGLIGRPSSHRIAAVLFRR